MFDYLQSLRDIGRGIFGVVDGAKYPEALPTMIDEGIDHTTLFQGRYDFDAKIKFPHVFRFEEKPHTVSTEFLKRYWKNVGLILVAPTDKMSLSKIRQLLKRFTIVRLPEGNEVIFRFYDPRVARVIVPTMDEKQADLFFQNDFRYLVPTSKADQKEGADFIHYQWKDGAVSAKKLNSKNYA